MWHMYLSTSTAWHNAVEVERYICHIPKEPPSVAPSVTPSFSPSYIPSVSISPSVVPSLLPSRVPSSLPSFVPSISPSSSPSLFPSLSPSLSQAPSILYAVAVCGSSTYIGPRYCGAHEKLVSKDFSLGVRCCSDDLISGWTKSDNCSVWVTSKTDGCHVHETWHDATKICAGAGGRLCTKEEMMADCTKFTGCQLDQRLVWTSTL